MTFQQKLYPSFSLIVIVSCLFGVPAHADNFEAEEFTLSASRLLGPKSLSGEHYRINEKVINKGFMNYFSVKSDFGEFEAAGDYQLAVLIHEIAAIAELQAVQKTEVFGDAVINAAKKPIETVQKIADEPLETLKGVPQGVGRLFKRVSRQVSDAAKDAKEYSDQQKQKKAASSSGNGSTVSTKEVVDKGTETGKKLGKSYLGQNKSIRALSKQLKVDPYSSNKVLQKEMANVAWAMTAGSFGVSLAMPGLPGMVGTLSDIHQLVWDTHPVDLQLRNEKSLRNMGVPELLITDFFENKHFTPSLRTIIVVSLEKLRNTTGRQLLIEGAAAVENVAEARSYRHISAVLAEYHSSDDKVVSIVKGPAWPLAKTGKGNFVFIAPVDYLNWTSNVSAAAQTLINQSRSKSPYSGLELRVQGRVSKQARVRLEALGWRVYERRN